MKLYTTLQCFTLAALLAGCGGDPGLDPICENAKNVGVWKSLNGGDTLNLDVTCEGSSSYCESSFTYSKYITDNIDKPGGITSLEVHKTNGKTGCPAVGMHTCSIMITSNMRLDCGGGEIVYVKVAQ
jgi:hypothetical protein